MTHLSTATAFFDACETGKGWGACAQYCAAEATFSCQSIALADTQTLEAYTDWMKGLLGPLPDGHYELRGMAEDAERGVVLAFAVFHGTHTAEGGPVPATGNAVAADYVYAMEFADGKVAHMTKIWNDTESLKALGWA